MINPKRIQLTETELNLCRSFSDECAKNQQTIEFGQKNTSPRKTSEIARDTLIGKIAEIAFCKLLKVNYNINVNLDFNYYPRGQWDSQDAEINGWRIDIKGTRSGGHWLLVEWNKLCFRQRDNNLSHVFVMFSVDWNRETDSPIGTAAFEGIASLNKMHSNTPNTYTLLKGSCIPGTHTRLQADNYGIRFENLYTNLDVFVSFLKKEPPISIINSFTNPYTGALSNQLGNAVCSEMEIEQPSENEVFIGINQIKKSFSVKAKDILLKLFRL